TLLGTDHVYVIPGDKTKKPAKPGTIDVEVTLTPEEMEGLDDAGIKALYEEKVAEARRAANTREDFSSLVAENAAKQKRKAAAKQDPLKKQKTGKDFKF
ncbi:PSP domain-containing protein, partial [Haematococcus lacustris]